ARGRSPIPLASPGGRWDKRRVTENIFGSDLVDGLGVCRFGVCLSIVNPEIACGVCDWRRGLPVAGSCGVVDGARADAGVVEEPGKMRGVWEGPSRSEGGLSGMREEEVCRLGLLNPD